MTPGHQLSQPFPAPRARFRHASHVLQTRHGETTVLFDRRSYFTLPDAVANWIWMLLREGASVEELVVAVEAEFDAPRDRIAADVEAFVGQLLRERLIEGAAPAGVASPRPWWKIWGSSR